MRVEDQQPSDSTPRPMTPCDAQLQQNVNAAVCERNLRLLMRLQAVSGKPWRKSPSTWQFYIQCQLISALHEGCSIISECYKGPGYIMQIDHRHCVHWTLWVSSWRWADSRTRQILSVWDGFALKLGRILAEHCPGLMNVQSFTGCATRLIHSSSSQGPLSLHNYLEN